MVRHALTIVSIAMIASACSVNRQPPIREIQGNAILNDTRVFYQECIISLPGETEAEAGLFAGLATAFIPALVENAYKQLGNALTALGEDQVFTATASTPLEVGPADGLTCVQIARGRFLPTAADGTQIPGYSPAGLGPVEASKVAALGLDGRPDVLLEARVVPSSGGSAATLLATYLDYNRAMSPVRAPDRQAVGLALTVSFHDPGKASTDDNASSVNLVVGDVTPGSALKLPLPRVIPNPEKGFFGTLAEPGRSLMSPWFKGFALTEPDQPTPLTLTASITETRYGSDLAKFLAGVLTDAEPAATEAITTALIPSRREAAELAELQSRLEKESKLATDLGAAESARIDYCFTTLLTDDEAGERDRLAKSGTLHKAQIQANIAAAQAGRDKPYGSSLLVPVSATQLPSQHPICPPQ